MGEPREQVAEIEQPAAWICQTAQPSPRRSRPVSALLSYIAVVFIGGALLGPCLYRLVQQIAPHSQFAGKPFHRYLDRSLLAIALIGLWPLLRTLAFGSPWSLLRPSAPGQWRRLARGTALGFCSLSMVAILALAMHVRVFGVEPRFWHLLGRLGDAVGTAVAVGFIEEFLFRGAVFGALRRVWHWMPALVVSSLIYAAVHPLQRTDLAGPVTWHSGFDLLGQMALRIINPSSSAPALINLTLIGIILAIACWRTGDLYFSIGLHGGWVLLLKLYGTFTGHQVAGSLGFFGTEKVVDGWLAFIILLAVLIFLPVVTPRQRTETGK